MSYRTDRPLDNPINWSFRVGRVFGITIKVHVLFVLAALVMIYLELPSASSGITVSAVKTVIHGLGSYIILFGLVLLHEFGHCAGARYSGGDADEILIWPLGGLAYTQPANNPASHMITTLAGPMVNVVFCALTSFILVLWTGSLGAVSWNPFHPFTPIDSYAIETMGQMWVLRAFGISYMLLIFNMMPIFPFDGGRVLQAWLWPRRGYRDATLIATSVGMVGAIIIGVMGFFAPAASLLFCIGVFGYIECRNTRMRAMEQGEFDLDEFGYDFSRGYDGLDEAHDRRNRKPGFFERWRAKKAAERARLEREREEAHEQAVEDILMKVSARGLSSLTAKERSILEEETRRRRDRDADRI